MGKMVASWLSRAHLQAGGRIRFVRKTLDAQGNLLEAYSFRPERPRFRENLMLEVPSASKNARYSVQVASLDLSTPVRHVDMTQIIRAFGFDVPLEATHRASVFVDKYGLELIIPEWILIALILDGPNASAQRWKTIFRMGAPYHLLMPDTTAGGEGFWRAWGNNGKPPVGLRERIAYFSDYDDAAASLSASVFRTWASGGIALGPMPLTTTKLRLRGLFLGGAFVVDALLGGAPVFPRTRTYRFRRGKTIVELAPSLLPAVEPLYVRPTVFRSVEFSGHIHPFFEPFDGEMGFRKNPIDLNHPEMRRGRGYKPPPAQRAAWSRKRLV